MLTLPRERADLPHTHQLLANAHGSAPRQPGASNYVDDKAEHQHGGDLDGDRARPQT
jgi:hypothetical protein